MDQELLVELQLEAGQKLIAQLVQDGFPVTAACWAQTDDDGQWFLYIATPRVAGGRTAQAYRQVRTALDSLSVASLRPFDVKVIGEDDPFAQGLRVILTAVAKRNPRIRTPFRWGGEVFGVSTSEDLYVYPSCLYQATTSGSMTTEEVLQKTIGLMSSSGTPQPSWVTLKDGTRFQGAPIGVELVNDAMMIRFLEESTRSPRHYPVAEIAEIQ